MRRKALWDKINVPILLRYTERTALMWGFRNLLQKFKIIGPFWEKKNGFYGRCCFFWDFFLLHQLHEILAPGLKLIFHTTSFDRSHHILYMYYTDVWPHRGFSNFQRRTQELEIHFQRLESSSMVNWCLKATSFAGRDSIFPALKHRLKLANRFSMQHPGAHTVTKLPATKDKTAAGLCLLGSYQTWTSPQVT